MGYLTRTDFVIYVVWQPPTEEKPAPDPPGTGQELREAEAKFGDKVQAPNIQEFEKASEEESEQALRSGGRVGSGGGGAGSKGPLAGFPGGPAPGLLLLGLLELLDVGGLDLVAELGLGLAELLGQFPGVGGRFLLGRRLPDDVDDEVGPRQVLHFLFFGLLHAVGAEGRGSGRLPSSFRRASCRPSSPLSVAHHRRVHAHFHAHAALSPHPYHRSMPSMPVVGRVAVALG